VTTLRNTQSTPVERMCDYCHKKCHIWDTCWDLHGRPSGGRGRTGCGSGRHGGLGRTQQAYASDKAINDRVGTSEPTMEDMIARLTSHMTALQG
jgi:hypothetical protein